MSGRSIYAPPCRQDKISDLWFRNAKPVGWRECFQAILAEDFLSPVFAGLGFRDVFSFIPWADRGQKIEEACIAAYEKYVGPSSSPRESGLGANFSALTPLNSRESDWQPLLLLNSTSVEKGKRVIASHLSATYWSQSDCEKATTAERSCVRIFTDTYDVNEMLNGTARTDNSSCAEGSPAKKDEWELTIAGAAHNSARFTVVSPAGNLLRNGRSQGHVVDGGYFDNYGAMTAFDLADTLRWEFGLFPFVLLITNDPYDEANPGESTNPNSPPGTRSRPKTSMHRLICLHPLSRRP
jgi:hypothetical protein